MENRLKKGLGRGLSSLLGDNHQKVETNKISIKDLLGLTIIGCMTPCSLMDLANSSKLSLLKFFLG